ncbi:ArsR/SmtB family transcription factor [Macrococcus bovicus]|nr:metalloregulator ArsR/SmtB family transcription factor [Macrococcus bovicus]
MSDYQCDVVCHNEAQVARVRQHLDALPMLDVTSILKALADVNRAKIIRALCVEEELCVCDLACILDISIANTSSHLRKLHKQGLVKSRREGKMVYYGLDHDLAEQIMTLSLKHLEVTV